MVLVAGGAGGVAVEHTEVITHGQAETVGEVEAHTAAEHHVEAAVVVDILAVVVDDGVGLADAGDAGLERGLGADAGRNRRAAEEEEA